jgi:cation diffusion facilitator CzcD-associated flavoprotein CzcO
MIHVSADVMRSVNDYDVVVVGAGQAGLSAAYALAKAGLDPERYLVLDANPGPGGAWRHERRSIASATRLKPASNTWVREWNHPKEGSAWTLARYCSTRPSGPSRAHVRC